MQKIKYIIIFTLVLALGMVYIQLADYQEITTTLLENNNDSKTNTIELENKIITLETQNQQLQNTIISLEETLSLTQIKLMNQKFVDNNNTLNSPMDIQPLNQEQNQTTSDFNLTPDITIDDENEVTGFGLEYTDDVAKSNGSTTIAVGSSTPTTLYYYCSIHSGMGGSISIN